MKVSFRSKSDSHEERPLGRFVSTGTIEEKVFQRQLSKEGLQNIVDDKEEVI